MIPYGRQNINQDDIDAIVDALKSDLITQGNKVPEFESLVASYCGAQYGVAVNSATSALHIACMAIDIGPGDIVWTAAVSFVASANCALYCGAAVDFIDIDPRTFNLSVEHLREKLIDAEKKGVLPKAVIPVHMAGQSCDMESIALLAEHYGFKIIEDASHAIGGLYQQQKVGSCQYSDMTVFSFHPVKVMTSIEGGMVMTNNPEIDQKLRLFRSHGISRDSELMQGEPDGPWYYEQVALGYNYRMNDIQAALGISQLKRLDRFILRRAEIAAQYQQLLSDLPVTLPYVGDEVTTSWHLFIVLLDDKFKAAHKAIFEHMRNQGIYVQLHYIPLFNQPYYKQFNINPDGFVNSNYYYEHAMSLPIYFSLEEHSIEFVADSLSQCLDG